MISPDINVQLDSLYSLQRKGIKLGLKHTVKLLKFLGNPERGLTLIHVAGTNGKGSTCAHLQSILRGHGYKVGLYTSPHLLKFNERIRINGSPIEDDEIISFMKDIDTGLSHLPPETCRPKRRTNVTVRVINGETVVLDRQNQVIHQLKPSAKAA